MGSCLGPPVCRCPRSSSVCSNQQQAASRREPDPTTAQPRSIVRRRRGVLHTHCSLTLSSAITSRHSQQSILDAQQLSIHAARSFTRRPRAAAAWPTLAAGRLCRSPLPPVGSPRARRTSTRMLRLPPPAPAGCRASAANDVMRVGRINKGGSSRASGRSVGERASGGLRGDVSAATAQQVATHQAHETEHSLRVRAARLERGSAEGAVERGRRADSARRRCHSSCCQAHRRQAHTLLDD